MRMSTFPDPWSLMNGSTRVAYSVLLRFSWSLILNEWERVVFCCAFPEASLQSFQCSAFSWNSVSMQTECLYQTWSDNFQTRVVKMSKWMPNGVTDCLTDRYPPTSLGKQQLKWGRRASLWRLQRQRWQWLWRQLWRAIFNTSFNAQFAQFSDILSINNKIQSSLNSERSNSLWRYLEDLSDFFVTQI